MGVWREWTDEKAGRGFTSSYHARKRSLAEHVKNVHFQDRACIGGRFNRAKFNLVVEALHFTHGMCHNSGPKTTTSERVALEYRSYNAVRNVPTVPEYHRVQENSSTEKL